MSLYTPAMAWSVRQIRKPLEFVMDVSDAGTHINLLIYQDEYINFPARQQLQINDYAIQVAKLLQSYGVEVKIQGVPGAPPRL